METCFDFNYQYCTQLMDSLLYDCTDNVAILTFNRPKVLNAFSDEMRGAMLERLRAIETDDNVRCVVLTGTGKAFSAGGDVPNMVTLQDDNDTTTIPMRIGMASDVMQSISQLPKPVIAAVNGAAAGGGMNLALGCDMRFGSTKAFFSSAFVKIGLMPDWGGFYALPRIVGSAKAMELMMTGDRVMAAEALSLGMLNRVVEPETLMEETHAFAARLAAGPAQALAQIKAGVQLGQTGSLADVFEFEKRIQTGLFLTDDAREGMRAFVEKRAPKFS